MKLSEQLSLLATGGLNEREMFGKLAERARELEAQVSQLTSDNALLVETANKAFSALSLTAEQRDEARGAAQDIVEMLAERAGEPIPPKVLAVFAKWRGEPRGEKR